MSLTPKNTDRQTTVRECRDMKSWLVMVLTSCFITGCTDAGGGGGGGDDGIEPGIDGGAACSSTADTCGGETICVASSCVVAFPRVYAVRSIAVSLPTTDPNGAGWDVGGGAPDILVTVSVGGTVVATTSAIQDQFSATFSGPFDAQLIAGSTLRIDAYDEDVTVNDSAVACAANPITAALLRGRQLSCAATATRGSIMFRVEPK